MTKKRKPRKPGPLKTHDKKKEEAQERLRSLPAFPAGMLAVSVDAPVPDRLSGVYAALMGAIRPGEVAEEAVTRLRAELAKVREENAELRQNENEYEDEIRVRQQRIGAVRARIAELECKNDDLRAQVKHWEDKEASRGHKCWLETERAEKAEAALRDVVTCFESGGAVYEREPSLVEKALVSIARAALSNNKSTVEE